MSFHWTEKAWKIEGLSPLEKLTLLNLADHFNDGKGEAWPSLSTIALECCCSEKTVRNNLMKLRKKGLVDYRKTPGKVNRYKLQFSTEGPETLLEKTNVAILPPNPGITYREPGNLFPDTLEAGSTEQLRTITKPIPPKPPKVGRKHFDPLAFFESLCESEELEWAILESSTFQGAYREWLEHRRQIGKKMTEIAMRKQLKRCQDWGVTQSVRNIDLSIERGWHGIYDPRPGGGAAGDNRPEWEKGEMIPTGN